MRTHTRSKIRFRLKDFMQNSLNAKCYRPPLPGIIFLKCYLLPHLIGLKF